MLHFYFIFLYLTDILILKSIHIYLKYYDNRSINIVRYIQISSMRGSYVIVLFSISMTLFFVIIKSSIKLFYFISISLFIENSTYHNISYYFPAYYHHIIVQMLMSQIKYT